MSPMLWYWGLATALAVGLGLAHRAGIVTFDTSLPWSAWVVAVLVLLNGGWMAFDGGRALLVGEYVTPQSGPYAGALGPWATIVEGVGIEPRSVLMRSIFLVYGLAFLGTTLTFLQGIDAGRPGVIVVAVFGLWYVPFGTLINSIVVVLMLLPPLRVGGGG